MGPVSEFFSNNLVIVYLVYGLAFFALGVVASLQARALAGLPPMGWLWLLSAFGLLHGASEWIELASLIRGEPIGISFAQFNLALKVISFAFLIQFGVECLMARRRGGLWLRAIGPLLLLAWLVIMFLVPVDGGPGSPNWLTVGEITMRYVLALPGAVLTAHALWITPLSGRGWARGRMRAYFRGAAISFATYAVIGILSVPPASFFPASAINGDIFLATFGIPPPVLRALCGLAIGGFMAEAFVVEVGRERVRMVDLLKALHDSTRAIITEVGLDATLRMVVEQARSLLDTDLSFLALVSADGQTLEVTAAIGERTEALRHLRLDRGQEAVDLAVRTGRPTIVENCSRVTEVACLDAEVVKKEGIVAGIAAPLIKDEKTIGVLYVFNRRRTGFGEGDADLLAAFASQAAVAIDQARLLSKIEGARNRLSAVVETIPVGVLVVDVAGPAITNKATEAMLGLSREDIGLRPAPGIEICTVSGVPYPAEDLPVSRSLRRSEVCVDEELIVRRRDGSKLDVLVNCSPLVDGDGRITGAVAAFLDITPIRDLERRREEFVSVIAHDLRAPIAIITGYVGLLKKIPEGGHGSQVEQRAILGIQNSVHRLDRMVADLLDASRIEASRLTLVREQVDLPQLVNEVVERTGEITAGHRVEVTVKETAPAVYADAGRVEQILTNLLSNAAKYSFSETPINVEVAPALDEVQISVINRGPGIPPEERARLFTRFHRARAAQVDKVPGLGLGLYITKGLVEAHCGRIWLDSEMDGTTTFHFTLPIAAPAPEEPA